MDGFHNNQSTRKFKILKKELKIKYQSKNDIRDQERIVFSSLTKILFDAQQLHINLSGACMTLTVSLTLLSVLTKLQEGVMLKFPTTCYIYLPLLSIVYIYFTIKISELKINLKALHERQQFDLAHVAVDYHRKKKSELQITFNKATQERMGYCCGLEPPKELKRRFETLKNALSNRRMDAEAHFEF